jgi:hypothetical protein
MNVHSDEVSAAEKTIARFERLFPGAGRFAFDHSVSWPMRAKRILTLIKELRREGDVHITLVRGYGQPNEDFFVAVQKTKKSKVLP